MSYVKPGSKDIYQVRVSPHLFTSHPPQGSIGHPQRLKAQCDNMKIQTLEPSQDTQSLKSVLASSDVILDAIFGFSFKPPVRAPFDAALPLIGNSGLPIVSVDVPSGWNVDEGKVDALALDPDVLVSLTAPKEGVREFKGRHFLGGRFVPKYGILFHAIMHERVLTEGIVKDLGRKVRAQPPGVPRVLSNCGVASDR